MGRTPYIADKSFNKGKVNELTINDLEFFTWEKLDRVEEVKAKFGI
jgi:S-adenosylmethionine synthetase